MSKTFISALGAVAILLAGCGAPHNDSEKYYLVVGNMKSLYWEEAGAGLARAAAELKVSASVVGPNSFSPEKQVEEFQRILASKPAGILVSVSNPKLLGPEIDKAVGQGVPVITIDADAPDSKRLTFVGTNSYEAGLAGGRMVAAKLNGKGSVLVFTTAGQTNLEERLKGYRAAFDASPGIKIVDVVDIKGDAAKAFDGATAAVANAKQPIDAFVSLEGQSAKEVADVLGRQKITGKTVISMDTLEPTLDAIAKGGVTATIAQKPFTMAYFALRLLADAHLHKLPNLNADFRRDPHSAMPRFIDTGWSIVDQAGIAAYRESVQQSKTPAK